MRTEFAALNCRRSGVLPERPAKHARVPFAPYTGESHVPGVTGKATGFFHVEQDGDGRW